MSTIPLAMPYNREKLRFPAYVSEKLDGVPLKIEISARDTSVSCKPVSRQNKPILSCAHILNAVMQRVKEMRIQGDFWIVGEVTHPTVKNFKDVSGIVRRKVNCPELQYNIFECSPVFGDTFGERLKWIKQHWPKDEDYGVVKVIPQWPVNSLEELDDTREHILSFPLVRPHPAEGVVVRWEQDGAVPGSRLPGYMKWVERPSMDLEVVSFDEAIDKYGDPKGMVGRINVQYKDRVEGVGPGKLTHKERTDLWRKYKCQDVGLLAKIEYKYDPSYEGLREGTFQCWRPDKDEVSHG